MAASLLNTSYFCSDFNLRNLVGVSKDLDEHILITCTGVVKQYNVRDHKLIQSWTTKTWHPFTSAAICDPATSNVVAVINNLTISQWNHAEDDIDKIKRENFETPIYQLLVTGSSVYVVFTTGKVEDLQTALKTRKEPKPGCVKENESMSYVDIKEEEDLVVLLVKNEEGQLELLKLRLTDGSNLVSCNVGVKDAFLTGICLLSTKLFTLWSNGNMHCLNLSRDAWEKLPGRHYSTITSIKSSKRTKILQVAPSHIAIVGADIKDEGGVLFLWDVKFAMITSMRKLKMYHNPPMAWVSSKGIIVVDGGSLSYTRYDIAESTLATVFGSRISSADAKFKPEMCYGWDATVDVKKGEMHTIYINKSQKLVEVIKNVDKQSLSESILVGIVIATLIENKDLLLLNEVIEVFEDIPESCLVSVVEFYLKCDDSAFDILKLPPLVMDVTIEKGEVVKCPFGSGKALCINDVLAKPITSVDLGRELRKLSFEDTLILIEYIHFLITAGEVLACPAAEEKQLSMAEVSVCDQRQLSVVEVFEWLSLLLDAKYHQLVMTSEVTVHRLLLSCFTQLTDMQMMLQQLIYLEPLVKQVLEEKTHQPEENMSHNGYSLERLIISR